MWERTGIILKCHSRWNMRTDIPEEEMSRVLFHTMMGACIHYTSGFSWGANEDEDYINELIRLKDILLDFARSKS